MTCNSSSPFQLDPRFTIYEEVGSGGFGTVYRAWDNLLKREVALKLPHVELDQELAVDLLRREVSIAQSLTHSGIVRIHDIYPFHSSFAILMEFVQGETLASLLARESPVRIEWIQDVVRRICE